MQVVLNSWINHLIHEHDLKSSDGMKNMFMNVITMHNTDKCMFAGQEEPHPKRSPRGLYADGGFYADDAVKTAAICGNYTLK